MDQNQLLQALVGALQQTGGSVMPGMAAMRGVPQAAAQMPQMAQQMQQPQGQMQGGLSPAHNQIFENLRQVLMNLHSQGVPGMDKVLGALHNAHMNGMKQANTAPTMPQRPTGALQAAPTMGGHLNQINQVENMMPGGGR